MPTRSLVMVIGPGRSGTSSMAGALSASGYHVPNAIKPNDRNPRGFFEPRWVVNFHKRVLGDVGVGTLDADPAALAIVERRLERPELRNEVREWLGKQFDKHERLVIKDPRLVWFRGLWSNVAAEFDVEPRFVMMLRHPSEVSASRSTYYAARDVGAVGGWINVALLSEQLTAPFPRRIVSYPDLLADWRSHFESFRDDLGLDLDPDPAVSPHPVDEFIEPSLRRMSSGWDDVAVPGHLAELADRVHDALYRIGAEGDSDESAQRINELRSAYADTYAAANTLVRNEQQRRAARIRRRTRAAVTRELRLEMNAKDGATLGQRAKRVAGRVRARIVG